MQNKCLDSQTPSNNDSGAKKQKGGKGRHSTKHKALLTESLRENLLRRKVAKKRNNGNKNAS